MNERFLELAKQVWPDPNVSHVNHEKFAELLIQECDRLNRLHSHELTGVVIDTEHGDGFDDVCLGTVKRVESWLANDSMKKHFGLVP